MPITEPRTATEALRYAKTAERAERLRSEGYRFTVLEQIQIVAVSTPKGDTYHVDQIFETCDCPDFEQQGDYCKHLLAVESMAADNARCAEYERTRAMMVDGIGCDPFAFI